MAITARELATNTSHGYLIMGVSLRNFGSVL
jgi:hypothetical protein